MFKVISDGVAVTHACEGSYGFSVYREKGTLTKAFGNREWTGLISGYHKGLFELDPGTEKDFLVWTVTGTGLKVYYINETLTGTDISPSGADFATGHDDLICAIRVGEYVVFTDRGTTTPYKWKHGDAACTKLIDPSGTSGYTEYTFRYLIYFMERIIGLHTNETNGNISIRWTNPLPDLSGDVEFPTANQLFIPNDDPIIGVSQIGYDRIFVHCRNSIHQLIHYTDYDAPFRIHTVNTKFGGFHHSIVSTGEANYFYVKELGFVRFDGTGLTVISGDIENYLYNEIDPELAQRMSGAYLSYSNVVVWSFITSTASMPKRLLTYNITTQQWDDDSLDNFIYTIASWQCPNYYTWDNLSTAAAPTGLWNILQSSGIIPWTYYVDSNERLMMGALNYVLYQTGDDRYNGTLWAYRYEPIMDFGEAWKRDLLKEIWFSVSYTGAWNIAVYHRSGNTVGEVLAATWTSLGTVSCNSVYDPVAYCNKSARFHQIYYRNITDDQRVQIEKITFRYETQSEH